MDGFFQGEWKQRLKEWEGERSALVSDRQEAERALAATREEVTILRTQVCSILQTAKVSNCKMPGAWTT